MQPLQFDTAVLENAGALNVVPGPTCRNCADTLLDEFLDVNGAPVCARCRDTLEQYGEPVRGVMALARAAALWLTAVPVLWILGAVAMYRTFRGSPGPGHASTAATFAMLVLALSWFARTLH